MAHELSFIQNTAGDAFYVGQSAWHQHGTVLTEAPSLQEAMRLAGHNFEVELAKVGTDANGDFLELPGFFAPSRTDTGTRFGVVGKRYHPLQNKDAFAVLEPLLDKGLCTLETGGTLRDGADVWMLVKFNVENEFFASEKIVPFGLVTNNHSGRRQVMLMFTPIRVVCANTLGAATNYTYEQMRAAHSQEMVSASGRLEAVRVKHTISVRSRTVDAALRLFGQVATGFEAVADQYQMLKATQLDEELFDRLVLKTAAPLMVVKPGEEPSKRQLTAMVNAEAKRADVTRLWTEGKGHTGDGSAWEALNAVVESVDHNEELWKSRSEDRLQSLFDGGLQMTKQKVMDALVAYAMKA